MSHENVHLYEAMFLFPQSAVSDLQASVDHIREMVEKRGGEILSLQKWDERRLAYDIKGNKRGLYFLMHFRIDGSQLSLIERDSNLSEKLLRSMFLRADHLSEEEVTASDKRAEIEDEIRMRAAEPATTGAQAAVATHASAESATATAEAEPSPEGPAPEGEQTPAPESPEATEADGDEENAPPAG